MNDSTSILDLPTDPVGGGNIGGGVSLSATENVVIQKTQSSPGPAPNFSLDQTTINQIVNQLFILDGYNHNLKQLVNWLTIRNVECISNTLKQN